MSAIALDPGVMGYQRSKVLNSPVWQLMSGGACDKGKTLRWVGGDRPAECYRRNKNPARNRPSN